MIWEGREMEWRFHAESEVERDKVGLGTGLGEMRGSKCHLRL